MLPFKENFIDFNKDVQKIQVVLLATLSEKYPVHPVVDPIVPPIVPPSSVPTVPTELPSTTTPSPP